MRWPIKRRLAKNELNISSSPTRPVRYFLAMRLNVWGLAGKEFARGTATEVTSLQEFEKQRVSSRPNRPRTVRVWPSLLR